MSVADEHEVKPGDPDNPSIASHDTSNDDQISDHLNSFVPPDVLEQEASGHDHSSQTIKNWLLSFGQQKSGTNVSLRFKIDKADYPNAPPHSLLPILTEWLRTWFDRSLSDSQDRSNLSWLLQYTADYLELGHHSLDEGEIQHLCLALLYICENARQHSHLEGCLTVFLSVARVGRFPQECLQQTIKILTTASVILDRPLSRIGTCVQILAGGALHEATLKALYTHLSMLPQIHSQKASHEEQDFNSYLTPARGAARQLSALLNEHLENEKPILDLEQTLQALREACEVRILRFATEVLALLTNLLRGSRRDELLASDSLLSLTLDVYTICKESNTIHDISDASLSKTKSAKEEILARERRYKRDHALAVRDFQEAAAHALLQMTDAAANRAWGLIREHLDDLSGPSRLDAIEYVKKQNVCLPSSGCEWAQNLFILIDRLLIGKQSLIDNQVEEQLQPQDSIHLRDLTHHRIRLRLDVLHLCAQAIGSAAVHSCEETDLQDTDPSYIDVGVRAVKMILQAPYCERNSQFTQAFFQEMVKLCDIEGNAQYPYASTIIETLEKQILTNARDDHPSGEVFLAATECLRRIFLQGLGSASSISKQAYQSLLQVANCKISKSRRCRLAAMSLLFRLRCDTSGIVYIEASDDSAYIAGALCKTEESLNAMFSGTEAETDEPTRRSSSASSTQLWMYPQEGAQISEWSVPDILKIQVKGSRSPQSNYDLNLSDWLWLITTNLQEDRDWETYSYAIVHLGSQLMNTKLFEHSLDILAGLRGFLCGRVRERKSMFEPPRDIGLDKSDIALCFYHILTRMIPYYKLQPPNPHMQESRKGIDLVRAFRTGIAGDVYYGTARSCIHALAICCYETPEAIGSEYPGIIEAMAKTVSTPHVLVHILEFLAQVARLPNLHRHFMEEEVRGIFGICIAALKSLMSKDEHKGPPSIDSRDSRDNKRTSAHVNASSHRSSALHTPFRAAMLKEKGLKQYSCALAYHTMIFWFLSIPIGQRHKYVKEVTKQLTWSDTRGNSTIDEQTVVLIDLMQRTAFSDLPETARDESFSGDDYETTSFIDNNSVVTIETHKITGRSQITKRQAAGTTYAIYEPRIQPLPPHHDRAFYNELERRGYSDKVTPSHTFLNMIGSAVPIGIQEQPLKLNPSEGYVARAIRSIDLKSTVDSHKIAVTLLKEGQIAETDYLANTKGSKSFDEFLDHIGTRVSLKPPCPFTPFGLLYEIDGTETIAWRDRINEVVFEISTLMPNVEADTYQARKKSHMGNCLVLVVFNQSNQSWKWDYFESQATLVNIVITPTNRVSSQESSDDFEHEYFQVEVHTKEEYQNISAAAETKVVSKATLAPFVRMLALNANIFSECARNELTGDNEFPSSWRYRMQEIIKLRERTQQRVHDDGDTLAKRYDFSRWT